MKVYNHIDEFKQIKNAVVTIGTFDGVHIGHQKIISRLQEVARQKGGETVILTFFPHPRMILHPDDLNIKLISTMDEKAERLANLGIDHLIITPFTRDFSNLSPQEYIREVLVKKIGTNQIIIGYDHRFGKDRSGGLKELEHYSSELGYQVEEIPKQDIDDVAISSTKIRNAILSGDTKTAENFLGYPFTLTGKVIKGDQIGRQLGFPTANLFIVESYKLIPADGIYVVLVDFKSEESNLKRANGMAYIGHRPTINGMSRNIEVNIFDFKEDIYEQTIRLNFLEYMRGDQKFNSLEELKEQLSLDEVKARSLLIK
ncbi:MAG: bifunctional riboflavin kinase/FAD synthetase [Bacteroidetes bacterium]|jgi:riboflavin kinase / FMN adenylyltransferase|uniref:bifunctional riboflavin kinase/FAD synthetase n=1 Tax=Daejeonella sp. TaxID=2805397 RepID=UPI00404B937E|nr:bifunctional riboflavin kinase/FAD synthetase [Bacteroidota bacterium]